jgi:hypothetical protein
MAAAPAQAGAFGATIYRRMAGAYRRYVALSARDKGLVLEAVLLLAVVRAGLIGCSILRMRRILSLYTKRRGRRGRADREDLSRIQWAIAAATRRIPGATCLVQALTAEALLQRRGLPSELCLGVRKRDTASKSLEAHAWVLCDREVVTGGGDEQPEFTVLSRLSSLSKA